MSLKIALRAFPGHLTYRTADSTALLHASETKPLAESASDTEQVYFVPAFTGLGAPYWNADCRGAIFGLTRNTGPAEIAKAALESVAFQTRDLIEAMREDWGGSGQAVLRIDGGMVANDWVVEHH